jgi:hypothetical protein
MSAYVTRCDVCTDWLPVSDRHWIGYQKMYMERHLVIWVDCGKGDAR